MCVSLDPSLEMGNVDGVPIASQAKSIVQASRGDFDAARETQNRFTERCIVAAQLRTLIEAARGDVDAAADTQRKFLENARRLLRDEELVDSIPVVSQLKAHALSRGGDVSAAQATEANFTRHCIGVAQLRSLVEASQGKREEAVATQKEFLSFTSRMLDRVPIVGQAKAFVHQAAGDSSRAQASFMTANRATMHVTQSVGSALQDIFSPESGQSHGTRRRTSDHEVNEQVPGCGRPLSTSEIAVNTLEFRITGEQVNTHRACPICLQDFQVHDCASTLRCFHVFHTSCARQWLLQQGNCPVCRVAAAP